MRDLVPLVVTLARQAKSFDLNLTIDAEEADRLELSLDVIGRRWPIRRLPAGMDLASRSRPIKSAPKPRSIMSTRWRERLIAA